MRATLHLPRAATYADHLAVEEHSEHRHELIDGVIIAMAARSSGSRSMTAGGRLTVGKPIFVAQGDPTND
jgi:hypothetical protein